MKGIDPPHPTYNGFLSYPNTSLVADSRQVFKNGGKSGASNPSFPSINANSITAPKVSSPGASNFVFKVSITYLLDRPGGILIEHLNFIYLYKTLPALAMFKGNPSNPITAS